MRRNYKSQSHHFEQQPTAQFGIITEQHEETQKSPDFKDKERKDYKSKFEMFKNQLNQAEIPNDLNMSKSKDNQQINSRKVSKQKHTKPGEDKDWKAQPINDLIQQRRESSKVKNQIDTQAMFKPKKQRKFNKKINQDSRDCALKEEPVPKQETQITQDNADYNYNIVDLQPIVVTIKTEQDQPLETSPKGIMSKMDDIMIKQSTDKKEIKKQMNTEPKKSMTEVPSPAKQRRSNENRKYITCEKDKLNIDTEDDAANQFINLDKFEQEQEEIIAQFKIYDENDKKSSESKWSSPDHDAMDEKVISSQSQDPEITDELQDDPQYVNHQNFGNTPHGEKDADSMHNETFSSSLSDLISQSSPPRIQHDLKNSPGDQLDIQSKHRQNVDVNKECNVNTHARPKIQDISLDKQRIYQTSRLPNSGLSVGVLPKHSQIKDRIQHLLIHYRLESEKMSDGAESKQISNHDSRRQVDQEIVEQAPFVEQISGLIINRSNSEVQNNFFGSSQEDGGITDIIQGTMSKFNNFYQRQIENEMKRQQRINKQREQFQRQNDQELKFKPEILHRVDSNDGDFETEKKEPRNFQQFYQRQQIYKLSKIKKREAKIKEEQKKIIELSKMEKISLQSRQLLQKNSGQIQAVAAAHLRSLERDSCGSIDEGPRAKERNDIDLQECQGRNGYGLNTEEVSMKINNKFLNYDTSIPITNFNSGNNAIINIQSSYPQLKMIGQSTKYINESKAFIAQNQSPNRNQLLQKNTSTQIINPFQSVPPQQNNYMMNTQSNQNHEKFKLQLHKQAQLQLQFSKPRVMKMAEETPGKSAKQDRLSFISQSAKRHVTRSESDKKNRKEMEHTINQFLRRQMVDINQKKQRQILTKKLQEKLPEVPNQFWKSINNKSQKIINEKFEVQFNDIIQSVLKLDDTSELFELKFQSINSYQFTQIITMFGCAKTDDLTNDENQIFKKCEELWTCLVNTSKVIQDNQENSNSISLDAFKLYMMSIFSITSSIRINVETQFQYQEGLPYGYLNQSYQLVLSKKCCTQIKQQFFLLNNNKNQYEQKKKENKKEQFINQMNSQNKFTPQLLNQKINQKLLKQPIVPVENVYYDIENDRIPGEEEKYSPSQLTHTPARVRTRQLSKDYNKFNKQKEQWIKYEQQKQEEKKIEGCTFKPDLKKTMNKYDVKSSYFPIAKPIENSRSISGQRNISSHQEQASSIPFPQASQVDLKEIQEDNQRYNHLFYLSNAIQLKKNMMKQTLSQQKLEQENQECTFKPTLFTKSSYKPKIQSKNLIENTTDYVKDKQQMVAEIFKKELNKNYIKNLWHKENSAKKDLKQKVEQIRQKSMDLVLERSKIALKEREYQLQCKDRSNIISKRDSQEKQKPILFIDVDIGKGTKKRITVNNGDCAQTLAKNFCKQNNFDIESEEQLEKQINEKICKVMTNNKAQLNDNLSDIKEDEERTETLVQREDVNFDQEVGGRQITQTNESQQPAIHEIQRSNRFGPDKVSQQNRININHDSQTPDRLDTKGVESSPFVRLRRSVSNDRALDNYGAFGKSCVNDITSPTKSQHILNSSVLSSAQKRSKRHSPRSIDRVKNFKNQIIFGSKVQNNDI